MAEWPAKMSPALEEVLGLMLWHTGTIAAALRAGGEVIPRKAESEQAFVLFWLIGLALEHGVEWRKVAAARIRELTPHLKEAEVSDG